MSYPIKLLITSIIASLGLYAWNQFMPVEYNNLHVYFILPLEYKCMFDKCTEYVFQYTSIGSISRGPQQEC